MLKASLLSQFELDLFMFNSMGIGKIMFFPMKYTPQISLPQERALLIGTMV